MQAYRDWENIVFLPIVNSLVEEQLYQLENNRVDDETDHRGTKEKHVDVDQIELWQQLYLAWQASPCKTPRQVEWLATLKHGIEHLKQCAGLNEYPH